LSRALPQLETLPAAFAVYAAGHVEGKADEINSCNHGFGAGADVVAALRR
jgi:hypothetical protein